MFAQPRRVLLRAPSAQVSGRVAFHHVDHHAPVKIDQAGGVAGGVVTVGLEERRLIDAQVGDGADAIGIVDQGLTVLDDGAHHGRPAHAELSSQNSHWTGVSTNLAARFPPCPPGEHRAGRDVRRRLGPRSHLAVRVDAAPPALVPHQASRAPEAGQVPDLDRHPVLRLGPHPTLGAPRQLGRRLDVDDDLRVELRHLEHPEPTQSHQCLCQASTVAHRRGLQSSQPSRSRNDAGAPASIGGSSAW